MSKPDTWERPTKAEIEDRYWILVSAARDVVEAWEGGDLAGAVRQLDELTRGTVQVACGV